jgi:hypothetical protein
VIVQARTEGGQDALRPLLGATGPGERRHQDATIRLNQPEALILRFLGVGRAEEVSGLALGRADLIEIESDRDEIGGDQADDGVIG